LWGRGGTQKGAHSKDSVDYSTPPYKWWGSVAELTCHLPASTPYGIRLSYKTHRSSPTKDVTYKDPLLIRGPLIGGYAVYEGLFEEGRL
jgi:hypothetical protein